MNNNSKSHSRTYVNKKMKTHFKN